MRLVPRLNFWYSFEGPDWGLKSTGAQRAACLRALGKAVGDDRDVRENVTDFRTRALIIRRNTEHWKSRDIAKFRETANLEKS